MRGTVDEGTALYDDDGDGTAETAGDCDDDDPGAHPEPRVADGVDEDCDGLIDDGTDGYDDDGDGYTELRVTAPTAMQTSRQKRRDLG